MRCKVSIGFYVCLIAVCIQGLSSTASGENISLGELYPRQKLQSILLSRSRWQPFARAKDRTAWAAIPKPTRDKFISLAEEYLDRDIPALPASLYLEYRRIGNRSNYQDVWLERRKMLHCLVLAECMEGRGRFLDSITNVVWAICEESSWTWPAHVGAQKAGSGLPDTSEPVVALFSAETANSLAWTVYLLMEELDTVSPQICKRVDREIDSRILSPYLQRDDFGWMGLSSRSDGRRPNNWNPWINSNVLAAALLIEPDETRRLDLVHKVLRCLDNFLVPYPSDGSCDEGPSYWGHAGASVFDNIELLYSATGGSFNLYEEPVVQEIGRFIYRAHISDDYFVNIGDCDARLDIYRDLVFRYGRRIGDKKMQDFAAYGLTEEELFEQDKSFRSLARVLHTLFNLPNLLAAKASSPPLLRDVWLGDEDMQMMAARETSGSSQGLYVACWAGHNGQSHNHNDVGNFIIFADGRPFIVDIGRPTYTRQTFSSDRYKIEAMQSAYHNLPTVNAVMQEAARRYAAKDVEYEAKEGYAQLTMDIAPAYPEGAGIRTWLRTVRLNRGRDIQVVDSFELKESPRELAQSLITPCGIAQDKPGEIVLTDPQTKTRLTVQYDPDKLAVQTEVIRMDDESLVEIWGPRMSRILLKSKSTAGRDTWTLRFSK
ncbi:MAG: heparinase II/III family protein [Planctomycetota bacterium]